MHKISYNRKSKMYDVVKTVLIEKYAIFKGIATRREFWLFQLFLLFAYVFVFLCATLIALAFPIHLRFVPFILLPLILAVVTFVPVLAVGLRRFRDAGILPDYVFFILFALSFLPYIGIAASILMIVVWILPSQYGQNQS